MIFSYLLNMQSHPSWVCGLKLFYDSRHLLQQVSHPSWVCGLKHYFTSVLINVQSVTPFVGVWIETLTNNSTQQVHICHTLRGCVD